MKHIDWELHIKQMMAEDNRFAVEAARDTELALKRNGFRHSQGVIDNCEAWLKNPVAS